MIDSVDISVACRIHRAAVAIIETRDDGPGPLIAVSACTGLGVVRMELRDADSHLHLSLQPPNLAGDDREVRLVLDWLCGHELAARLPFGRGRRRQGELRDINRERVGERSRVGGAAPRLVPPPRTKATWALIHRRETS